jgi:TatD DNase family protein
LHQSLRHGNGCFHFEFNPSARPKYRWRLKLEDNAMIFADSHCHLDQKVYKKDLDEVLARFREAGGRAIMIAGIDVESSRAAIRLAETHEDIFTSVGVHPHDAAQCDVDTVSTLKALAKHPKVKAWGEIGLDYNRMYSPRDLQERFFMEQMEAADSLGLPIIFHERDTNGRFLEILRENSNPSRRGVVHCFSGDNKELKAYLSLGFYIGITGILTIASRGKDLRKLVVNIPADRLLIETDAPYLTPAPQKNKTRRNEPAFVRSVLLKLADVRNEDPEALSKILWDNTCRLFEIPGTYSP